MIIEAILNLFQFVIVDLFGSLLPTIDINRLNLLFEDSLFYLDLILSFGTGLIGFFINLELISFLMPYVIFIILFKYSYKLVMWIAKKIPLLSIE